MTRSLRGPLRLVVAGHSTSGGSHARHAGHAAAETRSDLGRAGTAGRERRFQGLSGRRRFMGRGRRLEPARTAVAGAARVRPAVRRLRLRSGGAEDVLAGVRQGACQLAGQPGGAEQSRRVLAVAVGIGHSPSGQRVPRPLGWRAPRRSGVVPEQVAAVFVRVKLQRLGVFRCPGVALGCLAQPVGDAHTCCRSLSVQPLEVQIRRGDSAERIAHVPQRAELAVRRDLGVGQQNCRAAGGTNRSGPNGAQELSNQIERGPPSWLEQEHAERSSCRKSLQLPIAVRVDRSVAVAAPVRQSITVRSAATLPHSYAQRPGALLDLKRRRDRTCFGVGAWCGASRSCGCSSPRNESLAI